MISVQPHLEPFLLILVDLCVLVHSGRGSSALVLHLFCINLIISFTLLIYFLFHLYFSDLIRKFLNSIVLYTTTFQDSSYLSHLVIILTTLRAES